MWKSVLTGLLMTFVFLTGCSNESTESMEEMLKESGKTIMVVHHDLQTVEEYFDHVLLLNKTVIAHGPTSKTFTKENIMKAYGGTLHWMGEKR